MKKFSQKNYLLVVCSLILTVSVIAGCGNNQSASPESESQSQSDTKSIGDTGNIQSENETDGLPEETEAPQTQSALAEPAPIPEEWAVDAVIYYPNADADGLEEGSYELTVLTPAGLIEGLIHYGVLPEVMNMDASMMETLEDNGETALVLSLSQNFQEYMYGQGTSGEYTTMASIVNTFLENFEVDKIMIQIEGEVFATGHSEYPDYLYRYNLEQ